MGAQCAQITIRDDGRFGWKDDQGGDVWWEPVVRTAKQRVWYAEGKARGRAATLPETVLAMVETRLAQFSLEARRVLRAASVFGEVFWESGVARVMAPGSPIMTGPPPGAPGAPGAAGTPVPKAKDDAKSAPAKP